MELKARGAENTRRHGREGARVFIDAGKEGEGIGKIPALSMFT